MNVAGILHTGAFSLSEGAHLVIGVGGESAGGEWIFGYDQITASGAITLTGGDLKLTLLGFPEFSATATFFLIANNSHGAPTGTFATLNGSAFDPSNIILNGRSFQLTYTANFTGSDSDGVANDVALVAVPEPGVWGSIFTGFGLLAIRRPRTGRRWS
ncbi:MAG: hypothetical protein JWL59_2760 [Chthoniobacteraceae bacterium]|nr:hypothetical protein [Chthoniobacteraceae bacterium]